MARAWDEAGRDVTDLVAQRDGRYLATFARGAYQGIAAGSFRRVRARRATIPRATARSWLVANGWIYPTDSSINVAIGQGAASQPRGLSLEAQDRAGPLGRRGAGPGIPGRQEQDDADRSRQRRARRRRARAAAPAAHQPRDLLGLRWPSPTSAERPTLQHDAAAAGERAELRYRGFSKTRLRRRGDAPETPHLRPAGERRRQRWRDLVGYYTRFGDVRELLDGVDDRYVIMNAGDELRLSFPAPPAAARRAGRAISC